MKNAFTIAELILTTIITAVICIILPITILKRDVKPSVAKKYDFIAKCTSKCIFDAHSATLSDSAGKQTKLDYNKNSNEFYTIELVGGGAGGTQKSFGYPGESKTIFLPSLEDNQKITNAGYTDAGKYGGILTGCYLMEAGMGGQINNSGQMSRICVVNRLANRECEQATSCDNRTIVAFAQGGIKSNEDVDFFKISDNLRQASLISSVKNDSTTYGWGGTYGKAPSTGTKGIIIIK